MVSSAMIISLELRFGIVLCKIMFLSHPEAQVDFRIQETTLL